MGNILKTLTPEQVAKLSPSFVEHLNSLNLMQEIRADVLMISVNIEEPLCL